MKVSIGQAAKELGVSSETLRRWESTGKIQVERTPKGHRRYDLSQLRSMTLHSSSSGGSTLAYARVATDDCLDDLKQQVVQLESFCNANGWSYEIIQEVGSGVNCAKRGLQQVIHYICTGHINRLIVTRQDRLLSFGSELILEMCKALVTEVIVIDQSKPMPGLGAELAQDALEVLATFSSRLSTSESHKNSLLAQALQDLVDGL